MPTHATFERFIAAVESNAHADAIEAFYASDASMRENLGEARVGRDALVARETFFYDPAQRTPVRPH